MPPKYKIHEITISWTFLSATFLEGKERIARMKPDGGTTMQTIFCMGGKFNMGRFNSRNMKVSTVATFLICGSGGAQHVGACISFF